MDFRHFNRVNFLTNIILNTNIIKLTILRNSNIIITKRAVLELNISTNIEEKLAVVSLQTSLVALTRLAGRIIASKANIIA